MSRLAVVHHLLGGFWKIPENTKNIQRQSICIQLIIHFRQLTTRNKGTIPAPLTWIPCSKSVQIFESLILINPRFFIPPSRLLLTPISLSLQYNLLSQYAPMAALAKTHSLTLYSH